MSPAQLKELLENQLTHRCEVDKVIELDQSIDLFFGISHTKIDEEFDGSYSELESGALSTSYLDYFQILTKLKSDEILIDLGAGHCRGSLLASYLSLGTCISIEYSKERVCLAQMGMKKLGGDEKLILQEDLGDMSLPEEKQYYFYFPRNRTFYSMLRQLLLRKQNLDLIVCESHGDVIFYLKALGPWLKSQKMFINSLPRHNEFTYLFRTGEIQNDISIKESIEKWWIINFDSSDILKMRYFHQILKQSVDLLVRIDDLDLIYLNKRFYLQNIHTGRVYNTDKEFKIVEMLKECKIEKRLVNLIDDPNHKKDKILLSPKLYLENINEILCLEDDI